MPRLAFFGKRERGTVPDPVCGTAVPAGRDSRACLHDGAYYYFCSDNCEQEFERDPSLYVGRARGVQAA